MEMMMLVVVDIEADKVVDEVAYMVNQNGSKLMIIGNDG